MKTIKMKNIDVIPVFNFLKEVELVGQSSRGRSKFNSRLEEKNKEFNDDLTEIRKDYFKIEENGDLKTNDDKLEFLDNVTDDDKKVLEERIEGLQNEEVEVSFTEYSTKYEALFKALDKLEVALKGQEAYAYDLLMTAYEENNKEEK